MPLAQKKTFLPDDRSSLSLLETRFNGDCTNICHRCLQFLDADLGNDRAKAVTRIADANHHSVVGPSAGAAHVQVICFHFIGLADEEELLAHIETLARAA